MFNFVTLETLTIITAVLLVTVLALLIWVWRITSHYNNIIKTADEKTLTAVLEGIQKTLSVHERKLTKTKKDVSGIKEKIKNHIQIVRLRRFNPFSNTGGNQSFMLALLDEYKNGVLITSLHSRENTRFYVKSIKEGVGENHQLSDEEQKLIKQKG